MSACKDCKFFEAYGGKSVFGECRRYPPTIFAETTTADESDIVVSSTDVQFPRLGMDEWCGEFKDKKDVNA